jgi:6-phosphogluconolactonase (cycloisomerase 2 family)
MPNAGSISAFAFNNKTGTLTFINKQSSGGENPVYISVHKSGRWVVNANYTGGSLAVLHINKDGSLQPAQQTIQHTGSSVNKERQSAPHVHSAVFSPEQDYLFAPDLGMDKIMVYRFDAAKEKPLTPAQQPFVAARPGSGPRHFTFHPNGKWAYLVEELSGTVVGYRYDHKKGALDSFQRIAAHPAEATGPFSGADIHVSPDGRFLYVSNRAKENNMAIFSINATTGKMKLAGYQSTLGEVPRNFIIEPSGKFLLVANQESGSVVMFKRDFKTGLLQPAGEQINVPQPVCLQFLKIN